MRAYAGETGKPGGVYVTSVEPGQPADKAGLQARRHRHGGRRQRRWIKTETTSTRSTASSGSATCSTGKAYVGDTVALHVQRAGKPLTINVKLEHRAEEDYVVPPYNIDDPPPYYVLGGLIFQELSRQYLKEWGANWQKDAPQDFVYLDRFQSELFPQGKRRVVILSQVLPANSTIGYDDFSYLVVKKVNGKVS